MQLVTVLIRSRYQVQEFYVWAMREEWKSFAHVLIRYIIFAATADFRTNDNQLQL